MTTKDVTNIRYALIRDMDVSNGEGIRASLFVQGCNFHCEGCFNKKTWDFNGGEEWNEKIESDFIKLGDKEYINGYSILGGECLDPINISEITMLCKKIKEKNRNKTIWIWTGYNFESYVSKLEIINYVDVVVDGQFVESLKNLNLKFKGSINQNIWAKKTEGEWEKLEDAAY